MTTINPTPEAVKEVFERAYRVLKFTPEEIQQTFDSLADLEQLLLMNVLLKSLNKEEIVSLNKNFADATEDGKKKIIEEIIDARKHDKNFMDQICTVAAKTANDHIIFLKGRGDDAQKQEVAKVMAEIGQ